MENQEVPVIRIDQIKKTIAKPDIQLKKMHHNVSTNCKLLLIFLVSPHVPQPLSFASEMYYDAASSFRLV